MKIKYIFKYLVVASFAMQLTSCTETEVEQKFDKTPTERLNARKSELQQVLPTSEFGWKAVYFTDNKQLGGFTHLFKFTPEGKVDMASDFNTDTKIYTSDYGIQLGSTVSLVFTTKNRIHLLSDSNPAAAPTAALVGKGYLGDFQFLYYGQENGELLFKTNRNGQDVRFVKATAQDWTDLPKNFLMIPNVVGRNIYGANRGLEIIDGTTKKTYDFNPFTTITRFTSYSTATEVNGLGIGYTPTGIVVSPAITVGEQKLSNFVYNSTNGSFTATGTNGVSASIKYSDTPFVISDDYKNFAPGQPQKVVGYLAPNLTAAQSNSVLCRTLLDKINAGLPANQSLARVQVVFNNAVNGTYIQYLFNGGKATITHFVTTKVNDTNKTIVLTDAGWTHNAATIAILKDLDAQLTSPDGLYIKKEAFTIVASNKIYTLANASNNGFRITAYQL